MGHAQTILFFAISVNNLGILQKIQILRILVSFAEILSACCRFASQSECECDSPLISE